MLNQSQEITASEVINVLSQRPLNEAICILSVVLARAFNAANPDAQEPEIDALQRQVSLMCGIAISSHRNASSTGFHHLKIDVEAFEALARDMKKAEVRNDDRGFAVNDQVILHCEDGRSMTRSISHIQRGYGLPKNVCVLSYYGQSDVEKRITSLERKVFDGRANRGFGARR